jgi:Flp pilus assembly protein TadD
MRLPRSEVSGVPNLDRFSPYITAVKTACGYDFPRSNNVGREGTLASNLADATTPQTVIEEVIPALQRAIRLSPRDPTIFLSYLQIGLVHLLQSHTDEAIVWFEKARNATPAHPSIRACLASAHALNGDTERAATELAEARRLSAGDRYASINRLKAGRYWGVPRIHALFEATYFAGLRKAGMPEE